MADGFSIQLMADGFSIQLIEDNSPIVIATTEQAVDGALEAVGMAIEAYAKLELEKPKVHADGTVRPNVDTGRLVNSITHTVRDNAVYVGTNVEYALYVEMGTRGGRGYPYLQPAVKDHVNEYKRILETHLKNVT